ncbi:MAG: FHA domain-containing protein [Kofleriaceae bacterium]
MTNVSTKADPRQLEWAVKGPVVRLRVKGAETAFKVPSHAIVIGTGTDCDFQLHDPEGLASRRHARVEVRDGACVITDLGSTNGTKVDGRSQGSAELAPGDTIQLGGCSLIAESAQSIELHELLRRFMGWSKARLPEVDQALQIVRDVAHLRAALILRGQGGLVGIARRLHDLLLGHERPFVVHESGESGVAAQDRAIDGTLVLNGEKLPRDIQPVLVSLRLPNIRVRLVIVANTAEAAAEVATMIRVVARIAIPTLRERVDELDRLAVSYAHGGARALGAASPALGPHDLVWVRADDIQTHEELEKLMLRIVAVRNWGVTEASGRLSMSHGALSRYLRRHGIAT